MLRSALAVLLSLIVLAVAAVGVWLAPARSSAVSRDAHTFLHIGCTHHAHGPRWHQDHGRILGVKPLRQSTRD